MTRKKEPTLSGILVVQNLVGKDRLHPDGPPTAYGIL